MAVSTTVTHQRTRGWTRVATGLASAVLAFGVLAGCGTDADDDTGTSDSGNNPSMMENPNGDGSMVPCEGSICHNPNHGAGSNPSENGGAVMPNPNGDGSDVPCEGSICHNPNHGAG